MNIHRVLIIAGASLAAASAAAAIAQEAEDQTPAGEDETAQETPEQIAARELCTETAAPGAHKQWSIREGRTCENSFAETCTAIRNADRVEVSYACFAPLPPLPPLPGDDAGDEETGEN